MQVTEGIGFASISLSEQPIDTGLLLRMVLTRLDTFENRIPSLVRSVVKEEIQSANERTLDCYNRMRELETTVNGLPSLVGDSVRKVVREEIQAAGLDGGNWTNTNSAGTTLSTERILCLRFVGEPDDALTGKEIKGKGGGEISVEVFDKVTGMVIESGPELSAEVEILILKSEKENEQNWSHEDFNSRIIRENDKTMPHFAKPYHVYLEKGSSVLSNAKLANDKSWSRSCRCRLGARIVGNSSGVIVNEAWTTSFEVSDSRGKLYAKRYPPSLSDEVWRLESIGKDGEPCKRLKKNNVETVEDFLFLLSVDPLRLKEIVTPPKAKKDTCNAAWKAMMDHAKTCNIEDKRDFEYSDSSEQNLRVVFNVVGELQGVIHDDHYILIDHVPEAEKGRAKKLMCRAFENRKRKTPYSSVKTLLSQFPCPASYEAPNQSIQPSVPAGCNLIIPTSPASQQFPYRTSDDPDASIKETILAHNQMKIDDPKQGEAPELSASAIQHGKENDWMLEFDDIEDLSMLTPHHGDSTNINLGTDFGGKDVDMTEFVSETPQLEGSSYCNIILQEDSIAVNNSGAANVSNEETVLYARKQRAEEAPVLYSHANQHLEEENFSDLPISESHYSDASNPNLASGSVVQDLAKDLEELVPEMSPLPQLYDNVEWEFIVEDSSVGNSFDAPINSPKDIFC